MGVYGLVNNLLTNKIVGYLKHTLWRFNIHIRCERVLAELINTSITSRIYFFVCVKTFKFYFQEISIIHYSVFNCSYHVLH